ncbi:MAG: energy transducer TonB [Gammaproteobacteria bacterium]
MSAVPFPPRAVFAALPLGELGPRLGLWAGRLLIAVAVNALLLWGVYRLVEGGQRQISEIPNLNLVDFVRLKEEPPPEPERPRPLPEKQPPLPDRPLDMPKLAMPQMKPPRLPKLSVPTAAVHVPLALSGGPFLGEVGVASGDVGFTLDDLEIEENVVPLYRASPLYPPRALRARLDGSVLVEFIITPEGLVHSATIVRADPPEVFDNAVLTAVKKWKFKPKIVGGHAVPRRARQEVRFSLPKG